MSIDHLSELNELKKENKKLSLESKLRKSMSAELGRQKELLSKAREDIEKQKNKIEKISIKLSRYLPAQIYEQIFSGSLDIHKKSERKKLTIFFSDIVEFTSLSEQIEAEELSDFLNFYLTEMTDIAQKYGGTIDKFIGDSIMIFFGDPNSYGFDKDAINCVDMALEMQSKITSLQPYIRKTYNFPFQLEIRVGINTGICNVGNFGSENRLDYTAIGRAINIASRLEGEASPGMVLISESTKVFLSNKFAFSDKKRILVKGVPFPIECFEVIKKEEEYERDIIGKEFKLTIKHEKLSKYDIETIKKVIDEMEDKI
jgi:class 3 adenylate cyclase